MGKEGTARWKTLTVSRKATLDCVGGKEFQLYLITKRLGKVTATCCSPKPALFLPFQN